MKHPKHKFKCDYWIFKSDKFETCDAMSTLFYKHTDKYSTRILTRCESHPLNNPNNFHKITINEAVIIEVMGS